MTLEQQVTSLSLSKRLKELGVKQESLFWWMPYEDKYEIVRLLEKSVRDWEDKPEGTCSAFTVAELGEVLPTESREGWLTCTRNRGNIWEVGYAISGEGFVNGYMSDVSEANARAKMLIYLLENKLI